MIQTFKAKLQIEREGKNFMAKVVLPTATVPFKLSYFGVELNGENFRTRVQVNNGTSNVLVPMQVVRKLDLKNNDFVKFRIKR